MEGPLSPALPRPAPPEDVESAGGRARLLKPTATIHIANRFSLVERKVLNALIWHAQRQRLGADERALPVEELLALIGFEASKNVDALKDALRRLVGTTIEWNLLGQDRLEDWGVCTFLASAKLGRGKVRYRLNPEIVERIQNPTLFAKIQLLIQTRFTSRHSLVLYEFLIDWLSRARGRERVAGEVSLDQLRTLLGLGPDDYGGAYKFLNRDVLKPSLAEIDALTDIEVHHAPVRQKRKVVALRLSVRRKASFQLPLDLGPPAARPAAGAAIEAEARPLLHLLIETGLSRRAAQALLARHPPERIARNLAYLRHRQAAGQAIARPAAYLRRAIDEDFFGRSGAPTPRADPAAFERFRERRCRERFAAMPAAWRQERLEALAARLTAEPGSPLLPLLQRSGLESPAVLARLMAELAPELLTAPEEILFGVFAAWEALQARASPGAGSPTPHPQESAPRA